MRLGLPAVLCTAVALLHLSSVVRAVSELHSTHHVLADLRRSHLALEKAASTAELSTSEKEEANASLSLQDRILAALYKTRLSKEPTGDHAERVVLRNLTEQETALAEKVSFLLPFQHKVLFMPMHQQCLLNSSITLGCSIVSQDQVGTSKS